MTPWTLNDLTLAESSTVTDRVDDGRDLNLRLVLTEADARAVQEIASHAGEYEESRSAAGVVVVTDTSPNGENTLLVIPDTTLAEGGWFVVDAISDALEGMTTHARADLSLKRIAGRHDAAHSLQTTAEFIAHDF